MTSSGPRCLHDKSKNLMGSLPRRLLNIDHEQTLDADTNSQTIVALIVLKIILRPVGLLFSTSLFLRSLQFLIIFRPHSRKITINSKQQLKHTLIRHKIMYGKRVAHKQKQIKRRESSAVTAVKEHLAFLSLGIVFSPHVLVCVNVQRFKGPML